MSLPPQRALLRGVAADLAAWFCIPGAFLLLCVGTHLLPATAVLPHLRVLALPLLGLTLLRLLAAAALPAAAARLVSALAIALLLEALLAYYILVVIGLQSWGRVVSWDLIASYGAQVGTLADTLQISLPLVAAALALAFAGLAALAWAYLRGTDWTPLLLRSASRPVFALTLCAGGAVLAIELRAILTGPYALDSEPVSLTFFPDWAAADYHGHAIDYLKSARLDAAEDAARSAYRPALSAQRRNVILIVVDALRADHMGIYGYGRDTTPTLARLENAGLLRKVDGARASCGSSFCGLLSIASSKYLHQLSTRPITLQEALRRHGYRIHMLLSGDHTLFYGLKKAYGEVDFYFDASAAGIHRYRNDDRIMLEHLAAYPSWDGKPVMMQFHVMAAHALHKRDGMRSPYSPAANYAFHHDHSADGRPGQAAINYYDNGVLHADGTIRVILETLERKGYLKDALVAITADHGEALGEHGMYQHANSVRDEVLRVPFLLVSYARQPARQLHGGALVSQIDIAPTVLAELGMPAPVTWQGSALQHPAARDFLHFQERWEVGLYDLRDPRHLWKYWADTRSGQEYAFDLTRDPEERVNLIGQLAPPHARELRLQVLNRGAASYKGRKYDEPG